MGRLIKRYPNRKLYDTLGRRYITLAGLSELIRQGEEITVVDHATGDDLTAATLAQVISGQERRRRGGFPGSVLSQLLHTQETASESVRQVFDWLGDVDGEIRRRVEGLIDRGEVTPEEGQRWLEKLTTTRKEPPPFPWEEIIGRVLAERGVPTRQEIHQLMARIDEMMARLS
jgi:polyhydroxyalkanoate synthesis repressor PhaR